MAEWGDIVSNLVDELGLSHFDLLGLSSGAPYSYAIAYKLPAKVGNIFIFSGIPALYDDAVLAVWPYKVNRNAGIPELEILARDLFFSNLSSEAALQLDIQDSMRNNCFGIALDFQLRCNYWGFVLSDLRAKVFMQHARTDSQVPFAAAEMTARLLPDCRFDIREKGDHFSKELLDDFLSRTVLQNVGK
jgi:pimeloyl-ACP methyl ester carboxylesterase